MDDLRKECLGLLMLLAGFALACGLLDDDATNITYEEDVPFSFNVDANEVCPDSEDFCSGDAQPSPTDHQLEPIEIAVDVDIVEKSGNDNLADYAGAFRSITVTRIEYQVEDNDLTFDLPETTLYVGDPGAESRDDEGVVELATIPSVDEATDTEGTADVTEENQQAAAEIFADLDFAAIVYGQPEIKEGQDIPPSGDAEVELTIVLEFTANPQDAL